MQAKDDDGKILNTASIWQRFVGGTIDFVLFTPVLAIPAWTQTVSTLAASVLLLPTAVLALAYPIYLHGRYGQTVGKLVVGIRLVQADGEAIGYGAAWARSSPDLLLMAALGFGLIAAWFGTLDVLRGGAIAYAVWNSVDLGVMLTNRSRRAARDFLAGTFVVSDQVSHRREEGMARTRMACLLRRRSEARRTSLRRAGV